MTSLGRLRDLTAADLVPLTEAVLVTLAVQVGLVVLRPTQWLALADRLPRRRPAPAAVDVGRIARFADVAERRVPGASTCLRRALVVAVMLRWRGVGARLRIGVVKSGPGLLAHAWVETEGGLAVGVAGDGLEYVSLPLREGLPLWPAPRPAR
jgi:transglutaminase superfamily protein